MDEYNIIAEVLAGRIKKVLPLVTEGNKCVLMKGRHIHDGVLFANKCDEE